MRPPGGWRRFIAREWLAVLALAGLVATSLSAGGLPTISTQELQVLFILMMLLIAVRGLEISGLFTRLSGRIKRDRWIGPKLVVCTFFMAMAATNDAALIVMVPLTLTLEIGGLDRVVILEALAANAGSALTPFGNPQNLFIYWYYGIEPAHFIATMAPFSGVFLVVLVLATLTIHTRGGRPLAPTPPAMDRAGYVFLGLLAVAILIVLHVLPVAAGLAIAAYAALFNRASLRIDYGLLVTFLCFFGIAEDLKLDFPPNSTRHGDTFLVSAAASQFISNVPTALVMAKLTTHWKALLWGTNAGGFGSLIGSLANLIAYRLYLSRAGHGNAARFTAKFLIFNFAALLISVGLYYVIGPGG
ncbi:MAG TPA: SLC13 family permease [Gammaproteobacteria bacterium]|nr:SLC13 family permease [Gammaproteobacteria bacterium]